MTIYWEQYEKFTNCPRAYAWSAQPQLLTEAPSPLFIPNKDNQYLIKGVAIQNLATLYIQHCLRSGITPDFEVFFNSHAHTVLTEAWLSQQKEGFPKISFIEALCQIKNIASKSFPVFWEHVLRTAQGIPVQFYTQHLLLSNYASFQLGAMVDYLFVTSAGRHIIYEGKNTKFCGKTSDDQVRWQAQILLDRQNLIDPIHYYIFFFNAYIRPVLILDPLQPLNFLPEHEVWYAQRQVNLGRLLAGESRPTPDKETCRFCIHRSRCPDVWVNKPQRHPTPRMEIL